MSSHHPDSSASSSSSLSGANTKPARRKRPRSESPEPRNDVKTTSGPSISDDPSTKRARTSLPGSETVSSLNHNSSTASSISSTKPPTRRARPRSESPEPRQGSSNSLPGKKSGSEPMEMDEEAMMAAMGLPTGFATTSGAHVEGNPTEAVADIQRKREYRQFLNRKPRVKRGAGTVRR